jgi:Protein of unknown function (DUF3426)
MKAGFYLLDTTLLLITNMLNTFLNDTISTPHSHRRWLAHGAFILCIIQLFVLTQLWWKPYIANTAIGRSLFSLEHLNPQSEAPLAIHIQEITRHSTQQEYWNIHIRIENQSSAWVSYPHLVLSFLDEAHTVRFKNIWSPSEYAPLLKAKAVAPHSKQTIQLWLKLPKDIPSEYNLEYFYPY